MKKLKYALVSSFIALFGFSLVAPVAQAKEMDGNDLGVGNEIVLKRPTKIDFVHIVYTTNEGVQPKVVGYKYLAKGTHLYGFYKGTEGVFGCFYNFKKGIPITKNVWPSIELNSKSVKVVHKYSYKYSYEYTIKHILHEHW